ncbi:MAG: multidrug effflux MFS transporter [Actinomycetota bacterium]|nr:multidrug effflux MFS transporter [Actinomycetota bacterium]MDA2972607.1 multidrug effflux MFS transporter [Actinomycetota bacterium]MDA3001756.1 multidrug effflux MFS transporter [Actinomycetota bacterium]
MTRSGRISEREFIAAIIAIMASTAVAIDVMLPAFPEMRAEYGMEAGSADVAWIITAFFLGMATGPWLYGPASDKFGRLTPLRLGLALYVIAAFLATVAPSWEWLIASRFVWGLGSAGPRSISMAMIRDRYSGDTMARLMSLIMAVFLLVPILAPAIGAGLIQILPWRSVFVAPAIFGLLLIVWSFRLPETLAVENARPFTLRDTGRGIREVLRHRRTVGFTLATGFLFGIVTSYLSASEIILEDVYGFGDWFPLYFGAIAILFALNSLGNSRVVERVGTDTLLKRLGSYCAAMAIVLLVVSVTNDGIPNFWILTIAIALLVPVAQGMGPLCNTAALTPVPHVAGTASALNATFTTSIGALLGNLGAGHIDGSVLPFSVAVTVYVAAAVVLINWSTRDPASVHREFTPVAVRTEG